MKVLLRVINAQRGLERGKKQMLGPPLFDTVFFSPRTRPRNPKLTQLLCSTTFPSLNSPSSRPSADTAHPRPLVPGLPALTRARSSRIYPYQASFLDACNDMRRSYGSLERLGPGSTQRQPYVPIPPFSQSAAFGPRTLARAVIHLIHAFPCTRLA
jgi:hypothetical protein